MEPYLSYNINYLFEVYILKILIIRLSAIGDIFHTFTILPDIRKVFKDVQIDWLVDDSFTNVAKLSPLIDNVISIPLKKWKKDKLSFLSNLRQFKKNLPKTNYDYIIDTQGLIKTSLIAKYLFNGNIYGLDSKSARESIASCFYDYKFSVNQNNVAVIRLRGLIAKIFNLKHDLSQFEFMANSSPCSINIIKPFVMFLHGTSKDDKKWSLDNWIKLSIWLIENTDKNIIITYSNEAEYLFTQQLSNKLRSSRLQILDKLPFLELVDVVQMADFVVGVDTGFTHLANLLHKPTIAIYQASNPNYVGMLESNLAKNIGGKHQQVAVNEVIGIFNKIYK